MSLRRLSFCILLTAVGGCASQHAATRPSTTEPIVHRRPLDPKATLTLDQIQPKPALPAPTTAPTGRPPLEALDLYAQARVAAQTNQRYSAINLLEQAAKLDPSSFSIQSELARNYMSLSSQTDHAADALEKAATINPNDLETQTNLGRLYLVKNVPEKAIERLRLAMQTSEYRTDDETAALTDYYLAEALGRTGYDRAALDSYTSLLQHLGRADHFMRNNPELSYLLSRPDMLYAKIGKLHENQGNTEQALQAYQLISSRHPDDLEVQQHVVELLLQIGRRDDAAREAANTVVRTHASSQSIGMLRAVYHGDDTGAAGALRKLVNDHPKDTTVLFALADVLVASGKSTEAVTVLGHFASAQGDPKGAGDVGVVRKEFDILAAAGKTQEAARVLLRTSTDRPDAVEELLPMFSELISPVRPHRLHPEQLQAMRVDDDQRAARAYWVGRIALGRLELGRMSMDQATKFDPPFAPAFRAQIVRLLNETAGDSEKRQTAINDLVSTVEKRGEAGLAKELLGTALLARANRSSVEGDTTVAKNLAATACGAFDEAEKLGDHSPDLRIQNARAQLVRGDAAAYEKLMWKLLSDRPSYEAGYNQFFQYYEQRGQAERAVAVSQSWLLADPQSSGARLLRIILLNRAGVADDAERYINELYKDRPQDPDVLSVMREVLSRNGKPDRFIAVLEDRLKTHPGDLAAVENLADLYSRQKRTPEAVHLLETARTAVQNDADLLYYTAHIYERIGLPREDQLAATEATLQMALKTDPNHSGANNDLGYTWADSGKNLPDAESMIRHAIEEEPDNGAYLDSLGWVLYKRGRFIEAKAQLEKAVEPEDAADPVVLDHLGDDLYRLDAATEARQRWQLSLDRLTEKLKLRGDDAPADDELSTLKLRLEQKLKQVKSREPVNVAPVVESTEKQVQAQR